MAFRAAEQVAPSNRENSMFAILAPPIFNSLVFPEKS